MSRFQIHTFCLYIFVTCVTIAWCVCIYECVSVNVSAITFWKRAKYIHIYIPKWIDVNISVGCICTRVSAYSVCNKQHICRNSFFFIVCAAIQLNVSHRIYSVAQAVESTALWPLQICTTCVCYVPIVPVPKRIEFEEEAKNQHSDDYDDDYVDTDDDGCQDQTLFETKPDASTPDVIVKIGCTMHMCVYEYMCGLRTVSHVDVWLHVCTSSQIQTQPKETISTFHTHFAVWFSLLFLFQLYLIEMLVLKFIRIMGLNVARR